MDLPPIDSISPVYGASYSFDGAPLDFDERVLDALTSFTTLLDDPPGRPIHDGVQDRTLEDIAMPHDASTTYHNDPESGLPLDCPALPPPHATAKRTTRARKRPKLTTDKEEASANAHYQSKRGDHNATERKYRSNVSDKILCLRDAIPAMRCVSLSRGKSAYEDECSHGDLLLKQDPQKYGKAEILVRALNYIKHLEMTAGRMGSEMQVLNTRIEAFEQLDMNGRVFWDVNSGFDPYMLPLQQGETLESIREAFKAIPMKQRAEPKARLARIRKSRYTED